MKPSRIQQCGFSLVEMAIVLAIIGLLLAGLLPTLSSQIEQQRRTETNKQLNEIREALLGYAMINGFLPCPTTTTDPSSANYGNADATCNTDPSTEGHLPWKTLGVSEMDAWGLKRTSTASTWQGYWRYRVDRRFADKNNPITLSTSFGSCPGTNLDCLGIVDNSGNTLTSSSERPVAIVFSTGPDMVGNGQNANTGETGASFEGVSGTYQSDTPSTGFDDMLIWIARPQLFNRMVTAGKLP